MTNKPTTRKAHDNFINNAAFIHRAPIALVRSVTAANEYLEDIVAALEAAGYPASKAV